MNDFHIIIQYLNLGIKMRIYNVMYYSEIGFMLPFHL